MTFGFETKFKREQILNWDKTHANDAVAAYLEDGELVKASPNILIKSHMARGDYKQTFGAHSQLSTPTGKLFGLHKGDKVLTVLIRLSQATEMPSNFQAESGSQLHSPTTTDGLYGVLSAKIA